MEGMLEGWRRYVSTARSADPEQAQRAKRLYERAIELDPELAPAWAFLATMHHDDLLRRRTDSREESLESLLRCAQRAISLDDQNSVAHLAMAFHHNLSGKPGRALASVDRAVELAPGWEDPRRIRAQLLSLAGDVEGAIRDLETAARLSPKNARFNFSPLALAHFSAGHYEEAVRWGERALESDPTDAISKGLLVASYAHAGRLEEARELGADLPEVSEEQLRSLLSSATEDFVDRMIDGLRRAGWRG